MGVAPLFDNLKRLVIGDDNGPPSPATVHLSQVGDEMYNDSAGAATANCGPASVIMAVRLVGREVPGGDTLSGEALIDHIRQLATSSSNRLAGTTNLHLQRILTMSECQWRVLTHPKDILMAVVNGDVVILAGNPTTPGCYTERYDYIDVRRWNGGHWIVVSAYLPEKRRYVVNDPQSVIGPLEVTADELIAFTSRDGGLGIAVSR